MIAIQGRSRWLPALLFALSAALASAIVPSTAAGADSAAVTLAAIKKIARDSLKHGDVEVNESTVRIEGGVLSYLLPDAGYLENPDQDNADPLWPAMRSELRIEVIREHPPAAMRDFAWKETCNKAEQIVGQQLEVAQSSKLTDAERSEKQDQLNDRAWNVFTSAIEEYAGRRGLKAEPLAAGGIGFQHPHQISLVTNPPGGQISLLSMLDYQVAQAHGGKPAWWKVADPTQVDLKGRYWYSIRRGDKQVVGAKPIDIDHDGKYELK